MKSYTKNVFYLFGLIFLINLGCDFNLECMEESDRKKKEECFICLVKVGNILAVQASLIQDKNLITSQDESGWTALHWIAFHNNKAMFNAVSIFNPDINKPVRCLVPGKRKYEKEDKNIKKEDYEGRCPDLERSGDRKRSFGDHFKGSVSISQETNTNGVLDIILCITDTDVKGFDFPNPDEEKKED